MTTTSLRRTLRELLALYFPRWKGGREWRLRVGYAPGREYIGERGFTDDRRRLIWIARDATEENDLRATIVHELCHAVTHAGHMSRWAKRMQRAARRARAYGEHEVAKQLEDDAAIPARRRAAHVYAEIIDLVSECSNRDAVLNAVATREGMTREELERHYPRARRVFDKERRTISRYTR